MTKTNSVMDQMRKMHKLLKTRHIRHIHNMRNIPNLWLLVAVPLSLRAPAWAKPISDAVSTVTDTETSDPNGFKLMIVCIGLLIFVAFTLIGVTIFYFAKQKNKSN